MHISVIGRLASIPLVVLTLFAARVDAQPVVANTSGEWAHKSTVSITGSGFGTKTTAAPVVWDDASGTNITDKWSGAWPSNNPVYNTMYRNPQRGISLPHNRISRYIAGAHGQGLGATAGYNVIFFKNRTFSSYPQYTYLTWYQRADDAWVFGDDNNFKTFAFSVGTTPYEMPNNWYLAYNTPLPDSRTSGASYIFGDDSNGLGLQLPDANGHNQWWGAAINPMSGVWTKIEMEIKYTNQTDGYVKLWENGALRVDFRGYTDRLAGTARTEGIGGYARMYNQPTNWRYFADVYLDYSRARVILGNAPTLAASTRREVQIPTAWSGSSITISANLGAFADGQQVYLYVVDSNGNVNAAGYPVVLGTATVDTVPPSVSGVSPASGASNVSATANVSATFSEAMNGSTFSTSTFELRNAANVAVSGAVTYDPVSRVATFNPAATLAIGASYTATIRGGSTGVKDAAGNALAANYSWTFMTSTTPPPPVNGPIIALGFEEASGITAVDSSGWGNAGVISGATRVAGRYGNGLQFDGVDDWVTVLDAVSLDLTSNMTLEAWVRPSALSGWRTILMKETLDGLAYALYANDNNPWPAAYVRRTGATASDGASGTAALALNTWSHLAATYDGTTLRLFLNGVEVRAVAANGSIVTSASALHIGGNAIWAEFFTGLIDEVRIYNRSLTATEIQADMATAVAPGAPTDTTPPAVLTVGPSASATGVSLTANVTATFSEAMQTATIGTSTVELRNVATNALVSAVVTYNGASHVVTLDPAASLVAGTQYRATILGGAAGVKDAWGNAMTDNYTWTFTIASAPSAPTNLRVVR